MNITLKTLTPLWTGGVETGQMDRLHETSLIGSLRWWYEAIVRGLGGYACDPTGDNRCEYDSKKHDPPEKQLCAACYLFGCTGWGRKFRLQTLSRPEMIQIKGRLKAIKENQKIRTELIPLRSIEEEEWCLLQMTLRLISEYGAIGGKTVFKPSDESERETEFHHRDFGLVGIELPKDWPCSRNLDEIKVYATSDRWRKGDHKYRDKQGEHDYSWASLQNFWCVKGRYLSRQNTTTSTFNLVVGRKQDKREKEKRGRRTIRWSDLFEERNDSVSQWLAGSQQKSKKVFSFKHPAENGRTSGFVNPKQGLDFGIMKERLQKAWPGFKPEEEFLIGEQILPKLLAPK